MSDLKENLDTLERSDDGLGEAAGEAAGEQLLGEKGHEIERTLVPAFWVMPLLLLHFFRRITIEKGTKEKAIEFN